MEPGSRAQRTRGSSLISASAWALFPSAETCSSRSVATVPLTCSAWPCHRPCNVTTLRALLLLALELGLAATLNPKDPNTCSFWER